MSLRRSIPLIVCLTFCSITTASAQRYAANVLYSNQPLPIYLGIDVGSGLTFWQHATPTYFATTYPYAGTPDTIHVQFPSGATPLFGFFAGISADFWLSEDWGIITKMNYNERRGEWNATVNELADTNGVFVNVPVTSDLVWMLRCISLEAYARYSFHSLHDLYVGAGLALTDIASDHYDLTQTLGGPPQFSFMDFRSGSGTGIRSYGIGGSLSPELHRFFGEFKLLAGFPFYISARWLLAPEITLGIPFTSIWNSTGQADYQANGISNPTSPLTVTGLIALKYQIR